jgi:integrase
VQWLREKSHKVDIEQDQAKLRWLDKFLGDKYLDEISRDLIWEVTEALGKRRKPATVNGYLGLIRAVLRMARDEWEWIDRIPRVRLYPERNKRVRWLSHEEAARLLKELPPHLADMAAFSLATGLRQKNVCLLKWEQVALERGTAWIHADQSKTRKAIMVPLNQDALNVLRRRQGIHPEFVFTYKDKPVLCPNTKAWRLALKRAGIEDFRWHDLRHTWASWHVQSGTRLQELMELGGWSTMVMVQRYAHLGGEHLKQAASRINGTITPHTDARRKLRLVVNH